MFYAGHQYEKVVCMKVNYALIGERIRYYREKKELSQQELADKVYVNNQHISRIEAGKVKLSLELLILIANELEVSANDLLVGNLTHLNSEADKDLDGIFSDCSNTERSILIKTVQFLKKLLSENRIQ